MFFPLHAAAQYVDLLFRRVPFAFHSSGCLGIFICSRLILRPARKAGSRLIGLIKVKGESRFSALTQKKELAKVKARVGIEHGELPESLE